jgi:hypothetical protein
MEKVLRKKFSWFSSKCRDNYLIYSFVCLFYFLSDECLDILRLFIDRVASFLIMKWPLDDFVSAFACVGILFGSWMVFVQMFHSSDDALVFNWEVGGVLKNAEGATSPIERRSSQSGMIPILTIKSLKQSVNSPKEPI